MMTWPKNPVIMKNAGFPAERKGRPLEIRFGNKSQEAAIREEYRRIDEKWLRMQCRLMLFLVLFTTAIEAVMYFVLRGLRVNVADAQVYFAKYLLAPLAADTLLWLGAVAAVHSGLPPMKKAYVVSILMAIMAFIVYTVHAVFPAVTAAFIIPMLATVVYADQNLTTVVAALCVAEKFCSDLFLIWDPGRAGVLESTGSVVNFGLSLVLLVIFYGICSVMILTEKEKNEVSIRLERERQRYQEESLTDQLTRNMEPSGPAADVPAHGGGAGGDRLFPGHAGYGRFQESERHLRPQPGGQLPAEPGTGAAGSGGRADGAFPLRRRRVLRHLLRL